MTHQQALLSYLQHQGLSEMQACDWLNAHCPHWQQPLPVKKQERENDGNN